MGHRRWSFGILMYELVYGFTPFRGAKRDQTFENILKRPLVFPPKPEISKPCQVGTLLRQVVLPCSLMLHSNCSCWEFTCNLCIGDGLQSLQAACMARLQLSTP